MTNLANIKAQDIQLSEYKVKEALVRILSEYGKPSFGSMSKRDTDILLFSVMQDLGLIKPKPSIYEVMQILQVTRSKARNLIYESALRKSIDEKTLEKELHDVLNNVILLRESDKVALEIDNPLLIDYLRKRLKDLKHLTDGSFSPELVKMEYDAFAHIYENTRTELDQKQVKKKLQELGIKPSFSLRSAITTVLQIGGKALAGRYGSEVVKDVVDTIYDNWADIKEDIFQKAPKMMDKKNN